MTQALRTLPLAVAFVLSLASAQVPPVPAESTCNAHVVETCLEPGSAWAEGPCNALYGGFRANSNNMHQIMAEQFIDSFNFLVMASQFNTDEVSRMGLHGLLKGYSDKLWNKGRDMMKYILKRGGRMGDQFRIPAVRLSNVNEEVAALSSALDMVKSQAEGCLVAHKHAMNKKEHKDPKQDSYDAGIARYLEKHCIDAFSDDVRLLAGHLNVLGKIARNDNTRSMGLHIYDSHMISD